MTDDLINLAIKQHQENEQMLVTLSQLSELTIDEVIKKVQQYPWDIGTVLDFYRIYGRFPNND
jgi:hypothetical protein